MAGTFGSIGNRGEGGISGMSLFALKTTYTALPGRSPDTNLDDAFDISTGFTATPFCFLEGTRIATPRGSIAVETLSIGDDVLTHDGRVVPAHWVGERRIATRFRSGELACPVEIAAGALGDGLPLRDLRVTADHALLLEGMLVQAGALVKGRTIRFPGAEDLGARYLIYHIETEAHDVILAQGLPAETFIDYAGCSSFENYDQFVALYGENVLAPEQPFRRFSVADHLPLALRQRLGLTAAASGGLRLRR